MTSSGNCPAETVWSEPFLPWELQNPALSFPQVMLFPLVPNLQAQKALPKTKRVLWYEVSWRGNSRRSFCLAKHTPTIHPLESHGQNGCKQIPCILPWEWQWVRFIFLGRGWKQTGFLGGLTLRAVSGFSQSSMQMKTAATKTVSCATTYSARKKASCVLEAAEAIIIFVQVSQHVSVVTYTASRTARGRGAREGDAKQQGDWGQKKKKPPK